MVLSRKEKTDKSNTEQDVPRNISLVPRRMLIVCNQLSQFHFSIELCETALVVRKELIDGILQQCLINSARQTALSNAVSLIYIAYCIDYAAATVYFS